jgi:FixJ family two-component response regulator
VEIHRSQVMQKMQARNLAGLVRMRIVLEQGASEGQN